MNLNKTKTLKKGENLETMEFNINKSSDSNLPKSNEDTNNEFVDYEKLSEAFEKDSRRYNKYLGDDLIKENLL